MLERQASVGSLTRSLRLGALTGKLVEVNLVLGIVRLALIVLAMVFSAIPLPLTPDMTGTAALPLVGGGDGALPGGQRFLPGGAVWRRFVQFWRADAILVRAKP